MNAISTQAFPSPHRLPGHMAVAQRIVPQIILGVAVGLLANCHVAFAQSSGRSSSDSARDPARSGASVDSSDQGFALVELFTSQGCSSCPPADVVLRQLDSVAQKSSLPVYVLSFHVDYWNRLGWTDPYSSPDHSRRQRVYAAATDSDRVYTPQMIVSGSDEFVGSNRDQAVRAVKKALSQPTTGSISLQRDPRSSGDQATIAYTIQGLTRGKVLNIAYVESPPSNAVPRGENGGRKLSHVNVVRSFKTVPVTQPTGSVTLELPGERNPAGAKLIAYLQDPKTMTITAAAQL